MNKGLFAFIVIALCIVGVVYYYVQKADNEDLSSSVDNTVHVPTSSRSTSIDSLESDLSQVLPDGLDGDFQDIEAEINTAVSQ